MGGLTKRESDGLVSLFHGKGGKLEIPKPFEREIFLFDTHVAGTTHLEDWDGLAEVLDECVAIDDKLSFFREPDNPHDPKAILIKTLDGKKIGYVPQADNLIFARLMDAGKLLFARVTSKKIKGNWLKISINVFLQE